MKTVKWEWKTFESITSEELYQILQLRSLVFVVEQNCVYQDLDDKDQTALHLMGWLDHESQLTLATSARLFLPNKDSSIVKFGRVVVAPPYRGQGYGENLVEQILEYLKKSPYANEPIVISAQFYLLKFYAKFGFKPQGEPYDEDGIKHIKMIK